MQEGCVAAQEQLSTLKLCSSDVVARPSLDAPAVAVAGPAAADACGVLDRRGEAWDVPVERASMGSAATSRGEEGWRQTTGDNRVGLPAPDCDDDCSDALPLLLPWTPTVFCVVGPSSSSPLRLWRARVGGSAVSQTTGVVSVEAAVPISLEDADGDMGSSTGCTEAVRLTCIEGGCVEVTVCMGETEFTVVVVLPSSHRTDTAETSPPAALPLLSLCDP